LFYTLFIDKRHRGPINSLQAYPNDVASIMKIQTLENLTFQMLENLTFQTLENLTFQTLENLTFQRPTILLGKSTTIKNAQKLFWDNMQNFLLNCLPLP